MLTPYFIQLTGVMAVLFSELGIDFLTLHHDGSYCLSSQLEGSNLYKPSTLPYGYHTISHHMGHTIH